MAQSRKFSDVLYTQEYVYPKFSNGAMSVAETYVALALGFLDPRSLPPMVIFHHDNKQWCRDTRRLTLARALERNNYFQVLKEMQVEDAKKEDNSYEKQYKELILKIRAMERRKLDGKM